MVKGLYFVLRSLEMDPFSLYLCHRDGKIRFIHLKLFLIFGDCVFIFLIYVFWRINHLYDSKVKIL